MPAVLLVPRENALPIGYSHPADLTVRSAVGDYHLMRVDHPCVDALRLGNPSMGWAGDERLQMYCDHVDNRWVLCRLENDEQYRVTMVSPAGALLSEALINSLIGSLQTWDVQKGWNPKVGADKHNAAKDALTKAAFLDKIENDTAPRLRSAIKRDTGAHF